MAPIECTIVFSITWATEELEDEKVRVPRMCAVEHPMQGSFR